MRSAPRYTARVTATTPEGGPTMQTVDEIPTEPYAEIVRMLLAAGAEIPERVGEDGPSGAALVAELGVDPPA